MSRADRRGLRVASAAISQTRSCAGAAVVVTARRRESLQPVCDEICGAGGNAVAVSMDVGDSSSVTAAVAEVVRRFGKLDILINNAGVTVTQPFLEVTETERDGCFSGRAGCRQRHEGAGKRRRDCQYCVDPDQGNDETQTNPHAYLFAARLHCRRYGICTFVGPRVLSEVRYPHADKIRGIIYRQVKLGNQLVFAG
jgi:NAD(P)-dependent dehydrogenase (short-subunit alcohol dehydrogenase family)